MNPSDKLVIGQNNSIKTSFYRGMSTWVLRYRYKKRKWNFENWLAGSFLSMMFRQQMLQCKKWIYIFWVESDGKWVELGGASANVYIFGIFWETKCGVLFQTIANTPAESFKCSDCAYREWQLVSVDNPKVNQKREIVPSWKKMRVGFLLNPDFLGGLGKWMQPLINSSIPNDPPGFLLECF